ncbi:nucleoside 2-deoxyribosyltransferase [Azorhizobium sp. AG788]|uniref:nucleoside 2-deoxyribosyltransferase n=1 Tax=Azorhizobium sp. AG788 TaxID=2183897 RepID=UPI0031399C47
MARVYLAGPEVFRPDAVAEGLRLQALCAAHGLEGLYPLDGGAPDDSATVIRQRCQAGIARVDAVVANISPFRGTHMDPGTAWEIGFAEARGLPVFLWSNDVRALKERVGGVHGPDGLRDQDGHMLEDFDQPENLMIAPPGVAVWRSPEEAIAEAARQLNLKRSLRMGLGGKIVIALVASMIASYIAQRLIGW